MQFTKIVSRAEGRTRTDNIIITNDSQLPIVLHRQVKIKKIIKSFTKFHNPHIFHEVSLESLLSFVLGTRIELVFQE